MKRFNLAGFATCGPYKQAKAALTGLQAIFPAKIAVEVKEYETRDEYMAWLAEFRDSVGAPSHKTSPFVWFEDGQYLGGRDDTLAWCRKYLALGEQISSEPVSNIDPFDPGHGFDYDLVVIGGGSGGLACSKEAKKLGAKVAVLDFVKPSPAGSKWGLGGTCVNVGCIPKKLMHTAALHGESAKDAAGYGWIGGAEAVHSWEKLRENVQDHIKSLNFGYRVQLREQGVTYLNKLGKFLGPNTLECTDSKGKTTTISSARFVIAVGGRPTLIECEGAEHAISSDDIFMKETSPGKTCVVGAGYVALECAGFLAGLRTAPVSVLVRSMLLRGFDRDMVDRVETSLTSHGVNLIKGVTPTKIEKLTSGKLLVTCSSGVSDEYDTVLGAVGRYADTSSLGLEAVNISVNPKNGKISCTNEQTTTPNIYAIGDVVDGFPELTPVAILAGRLLARRMFGGGSTADYMDYRNIATTVFTPLELGTVGYSEEDAISAFGADAVDCYVSAFQPLEWSIAAKHPDTEAAQVACFAKIVVNKNENEKILGLHIASPNAGEIMQGFGVAIKKGITYRDLVNTVGIHPTVAEEFTTMEITKSSGASIEKAGC